MPRLYSRVACHAQNATPARHLTTPAHDTVDSLSREVAALLPGVGSGDPESLGKLYDLVAHRLRYMAHRALGSRADAEDVVHDLFVGLPEALRHYRENGRCMSWLVTCTMRLALMRRRSAKRHNRADLEEAGLALAVDRPDLAPEIAEAFRRIRQLPNPLRDVVLLRIEGLQHAEIAQALGISEGNSRIRLARALDRLLPAEETHHD